MLLFSLRGDTSKQASTAAACLLLSLVFWTGWESRASEQGLPSLAQNVWVTGPTTVSLGIADLKVPAGYKFADAQGGRDLLTNDVPKGFAGLLAPDSGKWWVVFSYSELGHVSDPAKGMLDSAAILRGLSHETVSSLAWEMSPSFDSEQNSIEWALRWQSRAGTFVGQSIRLLARLGTLDGVVVRPYHGFPDPAPLKTLAGGVIFRGGNRYADFAAGDKLAAGGVAGLVTAGCRGLLPGTSVASVSAPTPASKALSFLKSKVGRLILGVLGGLAAIALFGVVCSQIMGRRAPRLARPAPAAGAPAESAPEPEAAHRHRRTHITSAPAESAREPGPTIEPSSPAPAQPVARLSLGSHKPKSQPAVASLKLKPAAPEKKVNGHRRGPMPKREFDYNRYFTDLLGAVSSHSSHLEAPPVNGFGSDSTDSGPAAPAENGAPAPAALHQASADILAHQRSLIEEQKRLIHEQSRLIEEKTRLLAQKDELLRLHSEMLDQKVL